MLLFACVFPVIFFKLYNVKCLAPGCAVETLAYSISLNKRTAGRQGLLLVFRKMRVLRRRRNTFSLARQHISG